MVNLVKKLIFRYKKISIIFIGIVILLLLLLISVFSNKISLELFLSSLIGYIFISMAINNVHLGLFDSLKKDSSDGEVIGRGILIIVSCLFVLTIVIQELLK